MTERSPILLDDSKKMRIMIIDDDHDIIALFKMILKESGHDILACHDPTECSVFKKPGCNCPKNIRCTDLLIVDIMMPMMNGIDLLRLQEQRGCKVPVFHKALMSASQSKEHKQAAREIGCHFIEKPFKVSNILDWIDQCESSVLAERKKT